MTPDGALTTLVSFDLTNSSNPLALLQATDGSFYGTTRYGAVTTTNSIPGIVFRLTVPRADSPKIVATSRSGSTITLTWLALRSRSYQLQYTTNLTQLNWTNSGSPIRATNTTASTSDALTSDRQRFYRVALLP